MRSKASKRHKRLSKELTGYPDTAAIDEKLQDVKTQLAKLHEQEQTLYGRLKETESEVSRLRGQTKGCELALREAEARLAKAADIWQEKPEAHRSKRPLK